MRRLALQSRRGGGRPSRARPQWSREVVARSCVKDAQGRQISSIRQPLDTLRYLAMNLPPWRRPRPRDLWRRRRGPLPRSPAACGRRDPSSARRMASSAFPDRSSALVRECGHRPAPPDRRFRTPSSPATRGASPAITVSGPALKPVPRADRVLPPSTVIVLVTRPHRHRRSTQAVAFGRTRPAARAAAARDSGRSRRPGGFDPNPPPWWWRPPRRPDRMSSVEPGARPLPLLAIRITPVPFHVPDGLDDASPPPRSAGF